MHLVKTKAKPVGEECNYCSLSKAWSSLSQKGGIRGSLAGGRLAFTSSIPLSGTSVSFRYFVIVPVAISLKPRGCTHQNYIRGSPSEKMEKTPKVSNYFAYYPKVSSSLMERTQKYHRIVKRQK